MLLANYAIEALQGISVLATVALKDALPTVSSIMDYFIKVLKYESVTFALRQGEKLPSPIFDNRAASAFHHASSSVWPPSNADIRRGNCPSSWGVRISREQVQLAKNTCPSRRCGQSCNRYGDHNKNRSLKEGAFKPKSCTIAFIFVEQDRTNQAKSQSPSCNRKHLITNTNCVRPRLVNFNVASHQPVKSYRHLCPTLHTADAQTATELTHSFILAPHTLPFICPTCVLLPRAFCPLVCLPARAAGHSSQPSNLALWMQRQHMWHLCNSWFGESQCQNWRWHCLPSRFVLDCKTQWEIGQNVTWQG